MDRFLIADVGGNLQSAATGLLDQSRRFGKALLVEIDQGHVGSRMGHGHRHCLADALS